MKLAQGHNTLFMFMEFLRQEYWSGLPFPPPVAAFWNSPLWRILLGWPCMAWLIASLSYASPFTRTRLWSKKGKDWRQKEKSLVEDEMVGWYHWPRDMNLNKFWETVKSMEAWCAAVHGVTKSLTWVSDWTELNLAKGTWEFFYNSCNSSANLRLFQNNNFFKKELFGKKNSQPTKIGAYHNSPHSRVAKVN